MPKLMSVAMTTQAVIERRKTVTRRKGWWLDKNGREVLKVGDRITLCEKVQGRKPGELLNRLCDVADKEMEREGFPGMPVEEFVQRFFIEAQGVN